jgi:uncharacterized protein YoxC
MVVEISVAVMAAAFFALAVYLIGTLKSARSSLDQANETLACIQQQLNEVSEETVKLLRHTDDLTVSLNEKVKSADPLFRSVNQVGEALHEVTSSVKQVSAAVSQSLVGSVEHAVHNNRSTMTEAAEWAAIAANVWHKWKCYRNAGTSLKRSNPIKEGEGTNV